MSEQPDKHGRALCESCHVEDSTFNAFAGRDNHRNANSGDLGQNVQDMTERETMMPNGDHVA